MLKGLDLRVKAVYLDSEFYDGKCLTLLQAHNYAYITPIIKWDEAIKEELNQSWSRTIEHDLTTEFDDHDWTVEFLVYTDCTYQNSCYDEHGVARHGYAVDAPFIETPRQAQSHYCKRFRIESTYRLSEKTTISTTTRDATRRLLFVVISLLFQNVWRYLHWEYVATTRRGGHRLWRWSFEEFIDMVMRAAWTARRTARAVHANRPLDTTSSSNPPTKNAPAQRVATPSCRWRFAADCDRNGSPQCQITPSAVAESRSLH